MKLVRDLQADFQCHRGSAVTIGNFDGLHLGHLSLLHAVRQRAAQDGLASVVVSFDPMAREFFDAEQAPPRIYNASERIRTLATEGIEYLWLLRFNEVLACLSAQAFVQRLVDALNPRWVTVGADFRFGRDRGGDIEGLIAQGQRSGFQVVRAQAIEHCDQRVSSTLVREALGQGDFVLTAALLGRPYAMYGRVLRGSQLGRKLGFPTANIGLRRHRSPVHGIFAVAVDGPGIIRHPAVASVGHRPTIGGTETILEVHLFDYDGDLYGQHLEVRFVSKLREEACFDNLDALTAQMHIDAAQARALLAA